MFGNSYARHYSSGYVYELALLIIGACLGPTKMVDSLVWFRSGENPAMSSAAVNRSIGMGEWGTSDEFKSENIRVVVDITLTAIPDDRTENPKNEPLNYKFVLNIPQQSPSGIGKIILVSDTNSGGLPNYQGNSYYNVVKPNGGYYTFQFTPITNLTMTQIRIVKLPTLSQVNVSTENTPNTKYTNVVTVRELGEFQMILTYTDDNSPGSTFTVTSQKFTL